MATTYSFRMASQVEPIFPRTCLYGSELSADSHGYLFVHGISGWWSFLLPILLFFGWKIVRIPIPRQYRGRFYLESIGRNLTMILLMALLLYLLMPYFGKDVAFRKWKVLGAIMALLTPWWVFEVMVPGTISISSDSKWTEYEFFNKEYALQFALMNHLHVQ